MTRQQLPPQIRKVEVLDRKTGKTVVRYQLRVDGGVNPATGQRQQVKRRFTTEKQARDALSEIGQAAATDMFVSRKAVTVEQLCADWLAVAAQRAGDDAHPVTAMCWRRCGNATATCRCRSSAEPDLDAAAGRSARRRHRDGRGQYPSRLGSAVDSTRLSMRGAWCSTTAASAASWLTIRRPA